MPSDSAYTSQCFAMVRLLVDAVQGEFANIPDNYLQNFHHTYTNGDISLVPAFSALSGTEFAEPWHIDEVVEILSRVNPEQWPNCEDIVNIDIESLLVEGTEAETLDYVEDNLGTAEKTEKVLKEVIESVFGEKVSSIRDRSGNFPSPKNNFLQEKDGTFAGTFKHENHTFHFEIAPTEAGWICTYRLSEKSVDALEKPKYKGQRKNEQHEYRSVRTSGWR